jgi:hypothetical protein
MKETLLDEFKCGICSGLVYQPLECGECESLFCKLCISDNSNCTKCDKKVDFRDPNKLLVQILNKLIFTGCINCKSESTFNYENLSSISVANVAMSKLNAPCNAVPLLRKISGNNILRRSVQRENLLVNSAKPSI